MCATKLVLKAYYEYTYSERKNIISFNSASDSGDEEIAAQRFESWESGWWVVQDSPQIAETVRLTTRKYGKRK